VCSTKLDPSTHKWFDLLCNNEPNCRLPSLICPKLVLTLEENWRRCTRPEPMKGLASSLWSLHLTAEAAGVVRHESPPELAVGGRRRDRWSWSQGLPNATGGTGGAFLRGLPSGRGPCLERLLSRRGRAPEGIAATAAVACRSRAEKMTVL
jgi:hypothetical protein